MMCFDQQTTPSKSTSEGSEATRLNRSHCPTNVEAKDPVVVVIDDDRSWLEAVEELLSGEGFAVKAVESGLRGLDLLNSISPALVILDVHLPEVSGFEILRELRKRKVETPVLMVSGDDQASLVTEALAHGASAFFRKPISSRLLLRAIHRYTVS